MFANLQYFDRAFHPFYEKEYIAVLLMFIMDAIIFITAGNILWFLGKIFWNSLTPGQQYIEAIFIVSSVMVVFCVGYAAMDIEKKIEMAFIKMKKEIEEKTQKISELEDKLLAYKGKMNI